MHDPESASCAVVCVCRAGGFSVPPGGCLGRPRLAGPIAMLTACLAWLPAAWAGGGPENVAVVINADSFASQAVANAFIEFRQIPPSHVVLLPLGDLPDFETVDVEVFRERLLRPALEALEQRKLAAQIDYLVYSADVPYAVRVRADVGDRQLPQMLTPTASANGLTYLYGFTLAKNPAYLSLAINAYDRSPTRGGPLRRRPWTKEESEQFREALKQLPDEDYRQLNQELRDRPLDLRPTLGFRGVAGWTEDGRPGPPGEGARYLLSTMLAVTSGRGLSIREAIDQLRRSAAADSTFPRGTVYLMENGDIRSRTRLPQFEPAVARLRELGVRAEVVRGTLPQSRDDVCGLVAGSASFDWPACGSRILPGAICEHLTSFGGVLLEHAGQTPLTEFLRHGAALSSGTVTEPYAIAAKFPSPLLHVHYAQGCSAAEAFYQSVAGPYQLLIVGDPLCAPWARRPLVSRPELASPLAGVVHFEPSARAAEGQAIAHFELFVDGVRRAACRAGEPLQFDSASLADGPHEFRLVAVVADAIQTQGRAIWSERVDNHGRSIQLELEQPGEAVLGSSLTWRAAAPQAAAIELHHAGRVLQRIDGERGQFTVDTSRLGLGLARLWATASYPNLDGAGAVSEPVSVRMQPPAALAASPAPPTAAEWADGLSLTAGDRPPQVIEQTRAPSWLQEAGAQPDEPLVLEGHFDVPADDLYQFQLRSPRQVQIAVDATTLCRSEDASWKFIPVALQQGAHRLRVEVRGDGPAQLQLRFGGPGASSVGAKRFRTAIAK